jgi:hypothetical protein
MDMSLSDKTIEMHREGAQSLTIQHRDRYIRLMSRHHLMGLGVGRWALTAALVTGFLPSATRAEVPVINKPPTAADWAKLARLPDFSGVWNPNISNLTRVGWNKRAFQAGDPVEVEIYPLRNGTKGGAFKKGTVLATGKVWTSDLRQQEKPGLE